MFVDGVGLGSDDPGVNALVGAAGLEGLLGAPIVAATGRHAGDVASLVPLDATLGVDGLPQSGTGQATMLTGTDAVRAFGRHFGPFVPTKLRPLVRESSVLARVAAAGQPIAFANAYPRQILENDGATGRRRRFPPYLRAGPPLAALGAGVLDRHVEALARGDAVASEILNTGWRERLGQMQLPIIDEATAAANLLGIVSRHRLTLYAHYATDTAGHAQDLALAEAATRRLDRFLTALIRDLPADTLLVVASDHGNLEDVSAGHTRNPALGLVAGTGHETMAGEMNSLLDVTPAILRHLGIDGPSVPTPDTRTR